MGHAADYVNGVRTQVCFANTSDSGGPPSSYFMYSCSSNGLGYNTMYYTSSECIGSPFSIVYIPFTELGNNYDDDYVISPQGMSYSLEPGIPTVAPSQYPTRKPTISSKPSYAPNYRPPAFTSGWLYFTSYYSNSAVTACSATNPATSGSIPDYVSGFCTQVCFANVSESGGPPSAYFMYSCSSNGLGYNVMYYTATDCTGTAFSTIYIPFTSYKTIQQDDDGYYNYIFNVIICLVPTLLLCH